MPISVVIVGPHFAKASALFNPNAFPPHAKADAAACSDRFAMLTHSVGLVLNEPGLDPSHLLQQLRENRAFGDFVPPPDKPCVVTFHDLSFLGGVYATLISLKSLLDLYARLIAKLLVPTATVFGFKSGRYKGRNVSGGSFLTWIEKSAPKGYPKREQLLMLLLEHISGWIDQAVSYRDAVVHDRMVGGIREACVAFNRPVARLRDSDVILPTMEDGQPVVEYCRMLEVRAHRLVVETIALLPGVEFRLLASKIDQAGH